MDRGWYFRFLIVVSLTVLAWLALWPSLDGFIHAPAWVKANFPGRISPGLDIRGGLRLAYEVEVDEAIRDLRDTRADQLLESLGRSFGVFNDEDQPTREQLEQVRRRVQIRKVGERDIMATFQNAADAAKLDHTLIETHLGDMREIGRDGLVVHIALREDRLARIREDAVSQAKTTITNRIDEMAVREANVQSRDEDIIVEVPGVDEVMFNRIRTLISQTARLEFKIVDDASDFVQGLTDLPEGIEREGDMGAGGPSRPQLPTSMLVARGAGSRERLTAYIGTLEAAGSIPEDHELLLGKIESDESSSRRGDAASAEGWRTYMVFSRAEITGDAIEDAMVANDPTTNKPYVSITFNQPQGADTFERLTARAVKQRMAIVLDNKVQSAPVIQNRIPGGHCQITMGGMRDYNAILSEASDLVVVLKAGSLPAPIRPSNEQLIGPTLGADAIQDGVKAALIGIVAVLIFMLVYYQVAGLVANVMVILNLLFVMAILAFLEGTLTLPGVAGIALTVAMAVDANVLINERIREELRAGKSPRAAVDQGFARAFWTIFDSQVTTFIAGIVLSQYGTGPIRGFAYTLMIGIVASLTTGVFCSRVAMDWIVRGLRVQTLRVG
ncbi:MAG: protein translocase subunit SecD [Sandaracinaceae bacterium]|jgi:preprotein translocase subunit SecD|nr:protein translocase subunit SecD [Sandaracinaceae bacterium]